jgi:hypothetical protein
LKALKLSENDLKASSRVCSFHFFGNERKKNEVPSLEIGEKFGAKSGRKNTNDKMRQYEKNSNTDINILTFGKPVYIV